MPIGISHTSGRANKALTIYQQKINYSIYKLYMRKIEKITKRNIILKQLWMIYQVKTKTSLKKIILQNKCFSKKIT